MLQNKDIQDYKKFALNQNMIEVSVGLILATAFHNATKSIADNLLMPIINYALTETNGNWRNLKLSPLPNLNLEIGNLIGSLLDFFIISFTLFLIYNKVYKPLNQKQNTQNKT